MSDETESHRHTVSEMGYLKFALFAILAFGAVQCQCASVAELESQTKELDIFLAAKEVINIVRNVVGAVEKGINDSKPSVDILVMQLTPELGKAVKKVIDDVLVLLRKEKSRIELIIKQVDELLAAIKKIKQCTDPVKKDIEKVIGNLENGFLDAVRKTVKNQTESLNDLETGFYSLLNKTRALFDDEVKAVIGCIKPGHPDAKKCIDTEIEKIKKAVVGLAIKAIMFVDQATEIVIDFAFELVGRSKPILDQFDKEKDPIMKKISDCIAKMK